MSKQLNNDGSNLFEIILQRLVEEGGMSEDTRMVFPDLADEDDPDNVPYLKYKKKDDTP